MRTFVAVNLPADERRAAWRAAEPLREAGLPVKWVAADCLHVTIRFLGEVEPERVGHIGTALAEAMRPLRPFDLGIGGFGAFPDLAHARVVWCGVEIHPALELLANDVEHALRPFGFESALEPFRPHITLGRTRKDARKGAMGKLAELVGPLEYASVVPVASVDLMESRTGRDGATYTLRHAAPLGGGSGEGA